MFWITRYKFIKSSLRTSINYSYPELLDEFDNTKDPLNFINRHSDKVNKKYFIQLKYHKNSLDMNNFYF